MAQNWWDRDQVVGAPAPSAGVPQTIQGPPKVVDPLEQQRVTYQGQNNAREQTQTDNTIQNTIFNQHDKLRDTYQKQKPVTEFPVILGQFAKAAKAPQTGQGDLSVIYAFGKANDPGSVVREGEMDMAAATASLPQWLQQWVGRIQSGQRLDPKVRKGLIDTIRSQGVESAKAYNQQRGYYRNLAQHYGIDPDLIIGPHAGGPYQQLEADYSGQEIHNLDGSFGAAPKGARPSGPATPERPDINSLVSQDMMPEAPELGPRLTPEQESDLKAFLVTKPTPAQIQGRYASYGVGNIDEKQAQRAAEYYGKGGNQFGGVDYSKVDAAAQADARALKDTRDKFQGKAGAGDLIEKGALWNASDEVGGIGNAIAEAVGGDLNVSHNYKVGRDAQRLRQTEAENSYGAGAIPLEILGGFASGRPSPTAAAPAVTPTLTERLIQGGKAGAKGGAIYGFNSGEGLEDSLVKGGLGAGTGAAVGSAFNAAAPVVGNALARFGNRPAAVASRTAEQDVRANAAPTIQAANDENVPISLPFVDPRVRNRATYLETTRAGNPVVRNALAQTSDAMETRVGQVSSGNAQDAFGAGDLVQNAGHRFIQRSRAIANRMYDKARQLSAGAQVNPQAALQTLDTHLAELNGAAESNAPLIGYLQGLRRDLAQGGLSIDTLRNIRSQMRGQINSRNLTATDAERRVGEVLQAASGDIQQALQNNPQALAAYNRADQFYGQKQDYIKDVVQRFVGKRDAQMSPEQAFSRLKQMANARGGDSARMERMMRSLEPGEAADVAATFAVDLGRDRAGNFSPNLLASQIEQLSPRARVTLFGPDGARSLNNLQTLSREFRAVTGNLNNSRTGVANNYRSWWGRAMGLVGGGGGMASGGPAGAALGAMALNKVGGAVENIFDQRAARLLMSPDFTNWLRAAPATINPTAINAHIAQLDKVAARAPQFAADIQAFQQRLSEAIKGLPAAASTPDAKQDVKNRR